MEIQDNSPLKKKTTKKDINKKEISLGKDSIQYNCQDLDQEQRVNVNPVQLNTQNLHLFVCSDKSNYSGKITGSTYIEKDKKLAADATIQLFFGNDCNQPIYKTSSDSNGNFVIDDLPPGYYTLVAKLGNNLKYQSHYIKVFAGHTIHQSVLLK